MAYPARLSAGHWSINTVIQHFIMFLEDQGYTRATASKYLSALGSSLAGQVLMGYIVDSFQKRTRWNSSIS